MVLRGQPEVVYLGVAVSEVSLRNPHRRVAIGLAFDADHGEVLRINPDLSPAEVFVLSFRRQSENVSSSRGSRLVINQAEIVVFAGECHFAETVSFTRLLFRV